MTTAYLYASYWQCPSCKKTYCSLHSMFALLEQHRSELTTGVREIGVLCIACNRVSVHGTDDLLRTPDRKVRLESHPAQKVFLIELKCDDKTCELPVPVLASTGPSIVEGDFARLVNSRTLIEKRACCRKGHPPVSPLNVTAEMMLWSEAE